MENKKLNLKKYVFMLIVLGVLYYLVTFMPVSRRTQKAKQRDIEVSKNINELQQTTGQVRSVITDDKAAIDQFFFNPKTAEKIRGLIGTYPTDRTLKISDNLKVILKKEDNPVRIQLFNAEFELINARFTQTEDTAGITINNDVKVTENPDDLNPFEMIHYLKFYLVDTYGQNAFDNFLDETIADQIKENKELLDWFENNYIDVDRIHREKKK